MRFAPICLQPRLDPYLICNSLTRLIYERTFAFGEKGNLLFPVSVYPQIKHAFDTIRTHDALTVSVKLAPAGATGGAAR